MTTTNHLAIEMNDRPLHKSVSELPMNLTPEMYEKLFLTPKQAVAGDFRKRFGNPTPMAVMGFVMSLTPLSCDLMGWRGVTGAAANLGGFYYLGGACMLIGGFLEWILGNTFSFVVFSSFGGFWLSFATFLTPFYGIAASYSPTGDATEGAASASYNSAFAFWLLFWVLLCTLYFILSLKTNAVFAFIFLSVDIAFILLTASYWRLAEGDASGFSRLQKAGGAFGFACSLAGWYLLASILLDSLDFPFSLPVGDLSKLIPGKNKESEKSDGKVAKRQE